MDTQQFEAYYREHIQPHFKKLQEAVKEAESRKIPQPHPFAYIAGGFVVIGALIGGPVMLLILLIIGFLGSYFAGRQITNTLKRIAIKNTLLPKVFGSFGDFSLIIHDYGLKATLGVAMMFHNQSLPHLLPQSTTMSRKLKAAQLYKFSHFRHDDLLIGMYKDRKVEIMEIKLTQKNDKSTRTIFQGFAITVELKTPLTHQLILELDPLAPLDQLRDYAQLFLSSKRNLEQIHLEDPNFEKHFNLYSADQIYAREIFTPDYIEAIYNAGKKLGHHHIQALYDNNQITIFSTLNTNTFREQSLFEPTLPLTEQSLAEDSHRIYKEATTLFGLLDVFTKNL